MKEEELLVTYHVGDAIKIIQNTTHHLFDPDDLLTVSLHVIIYFGLNLKWPTNYLHFFRMDTKTLKGPLYANIIDYSRS